MTTDEHEEAVKLAWKALGYISSAPGEREAVDRAIRASERAVLVEKLRERADRCAVSHPGAAAEYAFIAALIEGNEL